MIPTKALDRFCVSRRYDLQTGQFLLSHDLEQGRREPYINEIFNCALENYGNRVLPLTQNPTNNFKCTKRASLIKFNISPKILDAPLLSTSYSEQALAAYGNMIAAALNVAVYTYNLETSKISKVSDVTSTAVELIKDEYVVFGDTRGHVRIVDLETNRLVRNINQKCTIEETPTALVQADAITYVGFSSNGKITRNDVGIPKAFSLVHSDEDSTLKVLNIAFKEMKLGASYNNGTVKVWDVRNLKRTYAHFKEEKVRVRGLHFYKSDRLFTGSESGAINIFSLSQNKKISSIATDSEVTDIHFNQDEDKMVTTHGKPLKNNCKLWKFNTTTLKFEFQDETKNEKSPVLYSAYTPYKHTFLYATDEIVHIHKNCLRSRPHVPQEEPFQFEIR